jgi:hypothetical protein
MTRLKLLGAAAVVLSSALAGPAMAQAVITNPGVCAQYYPNANCQDRGRNSPVTGDYQRRHMSDNGWNNNGWDNNNGWHDTSWNHDRDNWNHDNWNHDNWNRADRSDGFWPADTAAGIVGGAVATAGAIATAPFRGDTYARSNGDAYASYNGGYRNDKGYTNGYDNSYAARNGFVCQPGTYFKGQDGRPHLCQ